MSKISRAIPEWVPVVMVLFGFSGFVVTMVAIAILLVVGRINRRDDPRYAKRPADAP